MGRGSSRSLGDGWAGVGRSCGAHTQGAGVEHTRTQPGTAGGRGQPEGARAGLGQGRVCSQDSHPPGSQRRPSVLCYRTEKEPSRQGNREARRGPRLGARPSSLGAGRFRAKAGCGRPLVAGEGSAGGALSLSLPVRGVRPRRCPGCGRKVPAPPPARARPLSSASR